MQERSDESEAEVKVVRAHLLDFKDLTLFRAALAEDERARASDYKVSESRDVFTLARGLLRLELAARLNLVPDEIRFDVAASGKPAVRATAAAHPDWRFSVSHTGAHVAIAFSLGADVGIDIERVDRLVSPLNIAKRYFTPSELQVLEALPEADRGRAFFAGWTRKEAIVKARGHTMAESLTTLTVDLDPLATHPGYYDDERAAPRPACRVTAFEFASEKLIGAVSLVSDQTPRLRFDVLSGARFD